MGLARIEVIDLPDRDLRTFKCAHCSGELTEKVQYKYSNQPSHNAAAILTSNRANKSSWILSLPGARG